MDIQKELIAEYDREVALTRKVLDAIPEVHDGNFKAHPKSMAFGRLVGHTAETPCDWAKHTLTQDHLEWNMEGFKPYIPASKAALLERFDKETAEVKAILATFDPAKWDETWSMGAGGKTWISDTRYRVFRNWVLNHMIHHRAQLGVDLRLQNWPVPGVYGPSADEMPS